LAALFWPDQSDTAALRNLRQTLNRLRHAIADKSARPPFLEIARQTLQFNAASRSWLDVAEFREHLAAVKQHRHRHLIGCPLCLDHLRVAADLYRGDFMTGVTVDSLLFEEWVRIERERLHQQALEVLHLLAAHYERVGEYENTLRYARRQLELESWYEEAHRRVMRVLALTGERNAALAHYRTCQEILTRELDVSPERETAELYERIKAGTLPHRRPLPDNLPPQGTTFIGREEELLQMLDALLDPDCRLLTLSGEGGIGKTRLALAAAARVKSSFKDGVWFVSLSGKQPNDPAAQDCDVLIDAIADALDLTFYGTADLSTQLFSYLQHKELLLILDNFEPFEACADGVLALLRAAPHVTALVTSRGVLNFQMEKVVRVKGLPVPASAAAPMAAEYSSIRLFAERAGRTGSDWSLNAATLPDVVYLCRFLEGIPLAIELAAAGVRQASPSVITHAIQQNLNALNTTMRDLPERHRSMRAVFEASWQRLAPTEQALLARLAIFQGGCSRTAAVAVAEATAADLKALLDDSLLRESDVERYTLHALLQQFAAEKCQASLSPEQIVVLQKRHAGFYMHFVEERAAAFLGPESQKVAHEIRADLENIRQAWRWSVEHALVEALSGGAFGFFYFLHAAGLFREGVELFQQAVDRLQTLACGDDPAEQTRRVALARLLVAQSSLLHAAGRYEEAVAAAQAADRLASQIAAVETGRYLHAYAQLHWGRALWLQAEYSAARECFNETVSTARELQGEAGATVLLQELEAEGLCALSALAFDATADEDELPYIERALQIFGEMGNRRGTALALSDMGILMLRRASYRAALDYLEQALQLLREISQRGLECDVLNDLGVLHFMLGSYPRAKSYFDLSLEASEEIGDQQSVCTVLGNLSLLCRATGENEIARDYGLQALRIATEIGDRDTVGYDYAYLGHALLGLSRLDEAADFYRRSLELRLELGQEDLTAESRAGLARVLLAQGEKAAALEQVDLLLLHLKAHPGLGGAEEPLQVYLSCFQVLKALRDPRAADLLATAHTLLETQAAQIGDPLLRTSFLENVPAHREIVRAWEQQKDRRYPDSVK
ncbi:MAG: BTAD domain-containing putative transcriptional regulator, partial [Anaerolineae bacterium]|nr:BTAD domain-containing putative transcriptional regulator [Anaerolineae bacterium]